MRLASAQRHWPYLVLSGLWLLLAVLFTSQVAISGQMPWEDALRVSLAEWAPWMLLSPVMFWLAGRFPVEGTRWWRGVLINLPVAVIAVVAGEWLFQVIEKPQRSDPEAGTRSVRPPAEGDDALGFDPPSERPRNLRPRPGDGGPRNGPMQHVMHFHLPICLFTVMAAHAYAYFRRYQEKERKAVELAGSLAEARLLALQMQLQPHFLFNALNALSALVHSNPDAADEMITNLSELLRRSLSAGQQREVRLGQELGYVECYLEIERVRFGDRLQVEWQVEPEAREALVPVLCLQSIVENAIRHGIERRQADIGRVRLAAHRLGDRLRVTVTDNGPGVIPGQTKPRGHGVGLGNTRSRLAALHGAAASVRLENTVAGGCEAVLELPFRRTPTDLTAAPFAPHENQDPHR